MKNPTPKQHKFTKIIIALLVVFTALSFVAIKSVSDENLHVYFLDVGQGDSIYVRYKNIDVIVDGGQDNSALYEIGNYRPFYDQKIEYVIISHTHDDHIVGLLEVLRRYEIGTIYMTDALADTDAYAQLQKIITEKNIATKIISSKQCENIDKYYDICFLYPTSSYKDIKIDNLNNTSIVAQLKFGAFKVILPGDLETYKQTIVAEENGLTLKSDILKAAHHGSSNGLNDQFMKLVSPELIIFSVGVDNKFGHPSQKYLDYVNNTGVKYLRTDEKGTIEIVSNGINFWIK